MKKACNHDNPARLEKSGNILYSKYCPQDSNFKAIGFPLLKKVAFKILTKYSKPGDFPGGTSGKEPTCQYRRDIRDPDLIPGSGRSPGGGHSTHSNIFAWRIPRDREAWRTPVLRVTKSQTVPR